MDPEFDEEDELNIPKPGPDNGLGFQTDPGKLALHVSLPLSWLPARHVQESREPPTRIAKRYEPLRRIADLFDGPCQVKLPKRPRPRVTRRQAVGVRRPEITLDPMKVATIRVATIRAKPTTDVFRPMRSRRLLDRLKLVRI
ncbi:MAG: hypothetical protein KA105_06900 [Caulobacter sp.]|nr:hypothetical protein [Caulobacter sp.]